MSSTLRSILILLCASAVSLQAQVLTPVTARELLPNVVTKAKADLATDAAVTHVFFVGLTYLSYSLDIDLSTGKATGWVYRAYSPTLDSSMLYIAAKTVLGVQVLQLAADTVTSKLPVNVGTTTLVEPWIDSPAAVTASKNGGATAFLQVHPTAKLTLAMVVNNPLANPVIPLGEYWMLRYAATSDTLTCLIWADSGTPLRCASNNAPHITSLPRTLARVGEAYSYDVDALGSPAPLFSLTKSPAGMNIEEATGLITWTPTAGQMGAQSVTVRAENANGTDEQSFVIQVQGAGTAPKIQSTPPAEATADQTYLYQIIASGTPAPTFSLQTSPTGMVIDAARGTLVWTPSRAQAGVYTVTVGATNDAGTDTQSWQLTVLATPRLQYIQDQSAVVGSPFTLRASADGYPAPAFTLLTAPSGMRVDRDSGTITWTAIPAQAGSNPVRIEARNKAGAQEQTFNVTVSISTAVHAPEPMASSLTAVWPNPFAAKQGVLAIEVRQLVTEAVTIDVCDMLGRSVRTVFSGVLSPGRQQFSWNGCSSDGITVAPGFYHVRRISAAASTSIPVSIVR